MRFKINEIAIHILTSKRCIIVGTKEIPYRPKNDYMRRKEIYPENGYDFLIMTKTSDKGEELKYAGLISVMDNNLDKIK